MKEPTPQPTPQPVSDSIKLSDEIIYWLEFAIVLGVPDAVKVLSLGLPEEEVLLWLQAMCEKAEHQLHDSIQESMKETVDIYDNIINMIEEVV